MLAIKRKAPWDLGKPSDAGSELDIFASAGPTVVFASVSTAGFGTGAADAAASILALVIEPGRHLRGCARSGHPATPQLAQLEMA
jgi:hypothetical protein